MKIHCLLLLAFSSRPCFSFVNTAPSSPALSSTRLFEAPEVLAEEGTWQAYFDEETTGLVYYFDSATGESLWEPPTDTFPEVKLPRKKQRLADQLRREYRQSIETEDGDANWFSGFFNAPAQVEEEEEQPIVSEQDAALVEEPDAEQPASPSWFGGIAAGFQNQESAPVAEESSPAEPKTAWFGVFGDSTAKESTEEKVEEKPVEKQEKLEKKPVEKQEKSQKQPSFLNSFAGKKPNDVSKPREVKKKDPKIGGVVKKPISRNKKEPTLEINNAEPIKIEIASNILPHPAKVKWGGEDAVFAKGRTFGVFDGVSGAEKLDGVPLYSRTLANEMKKRVGNEGINVQEMTKFLTEASDIADAFATGASTAVVASIGENGFLQALNVGDSCCMVIRDGKVAAKTREISHYWECPYQLSNDSPDRPKDGTKLNVELTPGDLIIMGSDGVFDNVDDDMILDTVGTGNYKAGQIAKKICNVSRKQSLDDGAVTPYAKQAQKRGIPDFQFGVGGKVDDVGCVVVVCK